MGEPAALTGARKASAIACATALLAALAYPLLRGWLLAEYRGFYPEHEAWRQLQLEERLANYGAWLFLLFAALVCWSLVLLRAQDSNALAERLRRTGPIVFVALLVLVVSLDNFFSTRAWVRLGRPCWDNYCYYAELLAKWLAGQAVQGRLSVFLREDYHANSPMGPLLIASLRLATGLETITSYRVCVFLATLGSAVLLWRGLLGALDVAREAAAAALVLFGTHLILVRSSFFPQTDAFVLLWTTALLVLAVLRERAPRSWHAPLCLLLLVTGLLVKLSFLPALGLLPLWRVAGALAERRRPDLRGFARDVLVYSLLPLALFVFAQWRLGLLRLYAVELRAIAGSDSHAAFVAMSLVHAAAVLGPLAWLGRRRFGATEAGLLAWTALYLVSLWLSRASGWDRFYLATLPPLAALAAHGLAIAKERLGSGPLWAGVVLAAGLNYAALWLELYY
jgi:hypothetical protein